MMKASWGRVALATCFCLALIGCTEKKVVEVSCDDAGTPNIAPESDASTPDDPVTAIPVVRGSKKVVATVDERGLRVELDEGPVVAIPSRAVNKKTQIEVEVLPDDTAKGAPLDKQLSFPVAVRPHGKTFDEPVEIRLPLTKQGARDVPPTRVAVARAPDEKAERWELQKNTSYDAPADAAPTVTVRTKKFSVYVAGEIMAEAGEPDASVAALSIDAGSTQTVDEGADVSLTATLEGASDVGIAWTQLSGPSVTLSGSDTLDASFIAPAVSSDTQLVFRVQADDGAGQIVTDEVAVLVRSTNVAPSASAGSDAVANAGSSVSLSAVALDTDGTYTVSWAQLAGPAVTLSGANTLTPSFTAPSVASDTELVFEVIVTDDDGAETRDTVSVVISPVPNAAPLVSAGSDQTVLEGAVVSLTGSVSDSDGSVSTVLWQQIGGAAVTLNGASTALSSFTAPIVKQQVTLVFELLAEDDLGASASDVVLVTVTPENLEPSVTASGSTSLPENVTGSLTGAASDADGSIVRTTWTQLSGTSVTIAGASTLSATFTPPNVTVTETLVFQLEVEDDEGATARDTHTVTVLPVVLGNVAPLADAGANTMVAGGSLTTLSGTVSDSDGSIVRTSWTQLSGTAVALTSASTTTPSFTAPVVSCAENLVFQLEVEDDDGAITRDRVGVVVSAAAVTPMALGTRLDFEGSAGGLSTSGTLWQRGTPTSGPGVAHRGSNVWATNLAGNYANNQTETLCLPPITRGTAAEMTLSFYGWVSTVTSDAMRVEALDPELGWTALRTVSPSYQDNTIPGWTALGRQSLYAFVTVDVPAWAGSQAQLRFVFQSNNVNVAAGAYLDDVGAHDESSDPDGDGLLGVDDEWATYGTDPFVADTDGDGVSDGAEITAGTSPLHPSDYPGVDKLVPGERLDFELDDGGLTALRPVLGDTGYVADNRWQHGVPASGPGVAYSGTRVWATNLSGNYADNDVSYLFLPAIDLSGVSDADLSFRMWSSAFGNDGTSVEVETAPNTWTSLSPLTPAYDGVDGSNAAAWNSVGAQNQYALVIVPLTAFAGDASVRVRLAFRSNGGAINAGAYIDDVGVHATTSDPDADGIAGVRDEWRSQHTNPFRADSDGDGVNDGSEVGAGTDPLIPTSFAGAPKLVPGDELDFEADDGGLAAMQAFPDDSEQQPDDRWQHGVVGSGPSRANSGTRVWATNLTGNYADNDVSYLYLPAIDLSGETSADLSFRLWSAAWGNDGMSVEVRTPAGTWAALTPLTPAYNGVDGRNKPAWNAIGTQRDYSLVIVPLDAYAGQSAVQLRFAFRTNGGAVSSGFYVDDLGVHGGSADPDGDGIAGVSDEWSSAGTDPFVADTDGDGVSDGQELADGTSPLHPTDSASGTKLVAGDLLDFELDDGGLVPLQPVLDDTGFIADDLWQHGAPGSGPTRAHSGTQVWATNLSGNYGDNDVSYLYLPPIDLTGIADADLSFRMWSRAWGNDGLSVEAQTASGTWTRLTPLTPAYNGVDGSGAAAWNAVGYQREYTLVIIPLTAFAGNATVKVRFAFRSNGGAVSSGFYLDDVAITAADDDPDADGLLGVADEWSAYGTDPFALDSDGDGADDGVESEVGTLARDPADYPDATIMGAGDLFNLETSDGGFATDGSLWQYGGVASGPGAGASGVRAWCTNRTGSYFDDAVEHLYAPPIEVPGATTSTFGFHLWNDVWGNDGLSVEIWDADLGWQQVAASSVLPYNATDGVGNAAWGDVSTGTTYRFAAVSLTSWAGQTVLLRLTFRSNGGAVTSGAYVDDFALADEAASDPDGDGLVGLIDEYQTYGTDPLFADTDGDGVSDGDEVANETDPLSASSF